MKKIEYQTPEMEVVKLNYKYNLLEGSDELGGEVEEF